MIVRYRSKPITPVDVVQWNGTNLAEIQALCPAATIPNPEIAPWILWIPSEGEATISVIPSEYVMKNVGTGTYSKLSADSFNALYTPS